MILGATFYDWQAIERLFQHPPPCLQHVVECPKAHVALQPCSSETFLRAQTPGFPGDFRLLPGLHPVIYRSGNQKTSVSPKTSSNFNPPALFDLVIYQGKNPPALFKYGPGTITY